MSITMDNNNRVDESYVLFNFSGDNLDQSSNDSLSSSPSSSDSSIGRNSDDGEEDAGENEVESTYKGSLDMMESLEEVLPIRKGISKYYNGKSKSFTNLAEEGASSSSLLTSSSSMKDLAKPENPYSRRRRNLLCHQIWENHNKTTPRGGISKKPILSSSRSALTLAMAVMTGGGGGEGSSCSGGDSSSPGSSPTNSGSPVRQRMMMLPPLYPRSQGSFGNLTSTATKSSSGFCAWRSYSVADFPRCFPATASDS
ncbi:hypothetical protein AALP_AA8G237500 [Arabis alpina]|uniref:Uncharacterized protein n=1 Tax=Arabis alpina TaxID=50452 RepID=A0A087G901_ARAAL|nr:hypothetical protein AALP_AA8G237500 [Arabis alpina]